MGGWLMTEHSKTLQGRVKLGALVRQLVPNIGTLVLVGLMLLGANAWAKPGAISPNAPGPSASTVNYQGRLADNTGAPLTGTYSMTFALHDAPSAGALVWGPEIHVAVPVSDGLFNVGLGSQTEGGIPTSVWQGDRYLEVEVGGETLSPRELIRSVPVAGLALTVPDGAIQQTQAPFAPVVYHKDGGGGAAQQVDAPILYSGWFDAGDFGHAVYDLSTAFSQIDAVWVTQTRTSGGATTPATFVVTDAAGTGRPTPDEVKIWAYDASGNPASWVQAYYVVVGR
jgi:hypothetical protein